MDFASRTFSFSVDGESLPEDGTSFPFPTNHATVNANILTPGSLIVYAAPNTAQLQKSNYRAHFDTFSIRTRDGEDEMSGKMSPPRS